MSIFYCKIIAFYRIYCVPKALKIIFFDSMHKGNTFVSNIYSLYYSRRVTDQKFGVNMIFFMNTFIHQGCIQLIKSDGKCIILICCSFELSLKYITIENSYFIYILLLKKSCCCVVIDLS